MRFLLTMPEPKQQEGDAVVGISNVIAHATLEILRLPAMNTVHYGVSKGDPIKGQIVMSYVGPLTLTRMADAEESKTNKKLRKIISSFKNPRNARPKRRNKVAGSRKRKTSR